MLQTPPLPDGYSLRVVDRFPEPACREQMHALLLDGRPSIKLADFVDEDITARRKALTPHPDSLRVGIWHGENLIAWTFGWREGPAAFYMGASGVLTEHRRQGLYGILLAAVVEHCREQGYVSIWSRHIASNNPILIAKLRAGFVVSGMEMDPSYGMLLKLTRWLDPTAAAAFDARVGHAYPPPELVPSLVGPG